VQGALGESDLNSKDLILLPTGDGICLALLRADPFDLSLKLSLSILKSLAEHNNSTDDRKRQFEIRVGVNQNIDNLVIDINGNQNVAGRGINMAQRIMSLADGGQILVGEPVHEILRERELYINSFRGFPGADKHGNFFKVYQLVQENAVGLNVEIPTRFRPPKREQPRINEYAAHFIANATIHHDFLFSRKRDVGFDYSSVILLHLLTLDSIDDMIRGPYEEPRPLVKRGKDASLYPGIQGH
jgi:hypothetical protein